MTEPKIRYDIEAAVSGESDVNRLAAELEKLDGTIDPALAERARQTAQRLRELGETQAAVRQFVELRNATQATASELAQAQSAVDRFAAELQGVATPTRVQATELGKLNAALREAEVNHGRNVVELGRQDEALRASGVETNRLQAAQAELSRGLRETEGALRQLAGQGALSTIGTATQSVADHLEQAEGAVSAFAQRLAAAELPTEQEAQQLSQLGAALGRSRTELEEQVQTLGRQRDALQAVGAPTEALERQQAELSGRLAATTAEIAQLDTAYHQAQQAQREFAAQQAAAAAAVEAEAEAQREFAEQAERARRIVQQSDYRALFDQLEQQAQEAAAAQKRLADATKATADAFGTLGIKSRASVEADIARINAAMDTLRQDTKLSGAELEKAFAAGQAKVKDLQAELDGSAAAQRRFAEATKATADAFAALGIKSRASIEADIARINVAIDTLGRNSRISGDEFDRAFTAGQARIKALRAELDGVEAPAATGARGVGMLSSAVGGLTAAFSAYEAGRFVVNAATQLEQLQRVLVMVTGSTEGAAKQISFLRQVADQTGVSFDAIAQPYARFAASTTSAGIGLKTTGEAFAALSRAAGVLGLSAEDTGGALNALAQMASKGTVSMEELRQQLGERLPAVMDATARGLGLTTAQLNKLVESGKLLADEEFFAAFSRGMNQTFGSSTQQVEGLTASFARMKNAASEAAGVFTEAGGLDAIKGAMTALAAAIGPVLLGISLLFDGMLTGARQLGTVIAALVTGDLANLGPTLAKQMDDLVARQARMAEIYQRTIGLSGEAKAATVEHAQAMQSAATAAQQTSSAQGEASASTATLAGAMAQGTASAEANAQAHGVTTAAAAANAAAQGQAGTAAAGAGQQAAGSATSWAQLTSTYGEAQAGLAKQITAQAEHLKAAKEEGSLLVQLAELTGNEAAKREAAVTAAQRQSVAAGSLASAQTALVASQQQELVALEEYVRKNGDAGGQRAKQIETLRQEIEQSEAKRDAMVAEAGQLDLLAERRRTEIELARDNSGRIAELRTRYDEARQTQEAYSILLQRGAISQEEFNGKQAAAASAARLYRDALEDLGRKIEQNGQLRQADLNLANAKVSASRQEAEAALRMAEATGNEAAATQAKVRIKQTEIETVRNKVAAAQSEHDITLQRIEADRQEAEQSGTLTAVKERELEIRRKNADAKLIEAKGSDQVVAGLEAEIRALRNRAAAGGNGNGGGTPGSGFGSTGSDEQNGSPNADFRSLPVGASNYDKETYVDAFGVRRYKANGQQHAEQPGSKSPFSGSIDNSLRDSLFEKFDQGTLTADDKAAAEQALQAAKENQRLFDRAGWDNRGFQRVTDKAQAVLDRINGMQGVQQKTDATKTASASSIRPTTRHVVELKLNGSTTTVNTASASDADTLAAFMRQLQTAAGVAQ